MLAAVRRHSEMHVSALAEHLRLPLKTVSRNLRLLERAGLMQSDQRRGFVHYRVDSRAPSFTGIVLDNLERKGRPKKIDWETKDQETKTPRP